MLLILWLFIQSWISGYRDTVRFFQEKIWPLFMKAKWVPYWEIPQKTKLDPFHFAGGLKWVNIIILIVVEAVYFYLEATLFILDAIPYFWIGDAWYAVALTLILHIVIMWQFFFWLRNVFMHIAAMSNGSRQWKYLNPFSGTIDYFKEKSKTIKRVFK